MMWEQKTGLRVGQTRVQILPLRQLHECGQSLPTLLLLGFIISTQRDLFPPRTPTEELLQTCSEPRSVSPS